MLRLVPDRLAAALMMLVSLCAAPLAAQRSAQAPERITVPFGDWVAQGERMQIPWQVKTYGPVLGIQQRLRLVIDVSVRAEDLAARGAVHELILFARMADSSGRWFDNSTALRQNLDKPLPPRAELFFQLQAYVRPGDYSLALALYDRSTGEYSFTRRRIRALPIRNDPLAGADRDLPQVEFLRRDDGLDTFFQPRMQSRLWLPVETKRPVRIEVLLVVGVSEAVFPRRRPPSMNVGALLATLRVLSQMQIPNGTFHVSALDLINREVIFEQGNIRRLDWPRLRDAVSKISPAVVSADALEGRKQSAAFFRNYLAQRLEAEGPQSAGSPQPHRIFIVVSNALTFVRDADLEPLEFAGECNCRLFHLQYRIGMGSMWDDLGKVMRPLKPRRFVLKNPTHDLRKALGEILKDLRQL